MEAMLTEALTAVIQGMCHCLTAIALYSALFLGLIAGTAGIARRVR